MCVKNTQTTYGIISKSLHWIIAVLVIGMLCYGYFLDDFPKSDQPVAYNIHKLTGITILFLMLIRLAWALANPKPILPFDTTPLEKLAERLVHFSLYLFVILMPLAGWIGASAADKPPQLGDFKLALPIHGSKAFVHAAFDVHGTVAIILIVLISIHVLAALFHHFIRKDNILIRMLPERFHR